MRFAPYLYTMKLAYVKFPTDLKRFNMIISIQLILTLFRK